jgi:hypothetical protein
MGEEPTVPRERGARLEASDSAVMGPSKPIVTATSLGRRQNRPELSSPLG